MRKDRLRENRLTERIDAKGGVVFVLKRMKVSVGLAVFNGERYLERCLDGLVNQTLENLEIILVDDGSTDATADICDRYAARDRRVRVIHQLHGGLASARQTALEAATGDYFCVCDADDWMEPDMYEMLWNKAVETGADVVMCDYWREYVEGTKMSVYGKEICSDNRQIISDVLNERFPFFVWNKIFKRDIFERYNLNWEHGVDMGEDFLMILKILLHPVILAYLPKPLYYYRRMRDGNSYTGCMTLDSYNQMLRVQEWIGSHLDSKLYAKEMVHYQINVAYAGLRVAKGMTSKYYRQTSTSKLSIKQLLEEHSLKSLLILLTKVFGYRFGRLINQLFYKKVYR